ncbi:hypothetical protein RGF97_26000 [Streptomyces roseicoloratus]|uniref:ATP-binding protein n=1 Tax=Streptomyces roseicoloratus TaxID=2508722 RepID=A0ABY9RZG2_9ACTN|nr:hypothetical protein [Streptomyces roseicoloratus]WMX47571.1 hypothetical protein RGF97_26000 [Streptomyces roseicoloratus]
MPEAGAGFGKTLVVNTSLHELEPGEDVRKITFRARPTARAVRYELFTTLDLADEPPRHPHEFDRLLDGCRVLFIGTRHWFFTGADLGCRGFRVSLCW